MVTYYHKQKPMGMRADSDYDAMGYSEGEYTILDRRGYPAPWLDRKIKDEDNERILALIDQFKEQDQDDY